MSVPAFYRRCGENKTQKISNPMADSETTWRPRLASKARLRWDKIENQYMLMFPEAALKLNETAAEVIKLCDGERSLPQIVDALVEKFAGVERIKIEDNVNQLLTRIRKRGLLEGGNS